MTVRSLAITPHPVRMPGTITVTADVSIPQTINRLKMAVVIRKMVPLLANLEIPLPCIQSIGSCTYDDVCFAESLQCPLEAGEQEQLTVSATVDEVPEELRILVQVDTHAHRR
ncbi:PREDICTED: ganglioside GM2 activator-like [Priapulus caudatus]|uniref:Ganglioside GM2 activator-like n=1 Tax=Priapulus caudatus TaxID=37621 RepID=A0ABM1EWX8_PRICU|nr:PREDICTED: ganglioside GM2 activator-like [Priapulus caudatus]